jgi:hypothetical protein
MSEFIEFLIKVTESNKANVFKNITEFKNTLGLIDVSAELLEKTFGLNKSDGEEFLRKFYTWKNNIGGVALLYNSTFEMFIPIIGILENDKIALTIDVKNKREMWKVINETI